MAMTMTQKIIAKHSGQECVQANQFVSIDLDIVLGNDITAPVAIKELQKAGIDKVFDKNKICLIPDHFTPAKDIQSATQCAVMRNFAKEKDIKHYYEVGEMGIEHALLPEKGIVVAGDTVIGADSHTCTYGALGAFSTGVGSTDMAYGMATGKCWIKVPPAIKFNLINKPQKGISGKDIILHIIGMIGVSGALYKSMEFGGSGLINLTMDDRFTMANMAIEAGAKNGIFEVDELTLDYISNHSEKVPVITKADDNAEYDKVYEIDIATIPYTVSCPNSPDNTCRAVDLKDVAIDQVVIGSCTNGRLQDMRVSAEILRGKKIKKGLKVIIIPATQKIYLESMELGYLKIFIEAGCVVSTPTCGPCLGGHTGILAAGEVAVTTTNRNFVGRMGHKDSKIYLASPAVASASAITGFISIPNGDEL